MRMLKLLVVLILAGLIGLAGYAYFGDMAPTRQEVRTPLQLNTPAADQPAEAARHYRLALQGSGLDDSARRFASERAAALGGRG